MQVDMDLNCDNTKNKEIAIDKLKQIKYRSAKFFSNVFNAKEPKFTDLQDEIKDILIKNDYLGKLKIKDWVVSWYGAIAIEIYIGFDKKTNFKIVRFYNDKWIDNQLVYVETNEATFNRNNNQYYYQNIYALNSNKNVVTLIRHRYKYTGIAGQWIIDNTWAKQEFTLKNMPVIPVLICKNNFRYENDTDIILQNIPTYNRSWKTIGSLVKYGTPKLVANRDNLNFNNPQGQADELSKQWENDEVINVSGFNSTPDKADWEVVQFNLQWHEIAFINNWQENEMLKLIGIPIQVQKSAQQNNMERSENNTEAYNNLESKKYDKTKELSQLIYLISLVEKYLRFNNKITIIEYPKVELIWPKSLENVFNPMLLQKQNNFKKENINASSSNNE